MLAPPFSLCSNVAPHIPAGSAGVRSFVPRLAPRSHPGPPRFQLGFCCAKTGAAGYRPHLLGLPRKIGRGISLRETTLCGCPLRGHGFATPHRCFAVPVTAPPRRVPNGKTPALAPIRSHFAPRNRAGRSSAPPGPMFCRPRHDSAAPGPQRQNPGACSHSVAFRLRRNRAAGRCPRRGQRARYPIFAPLKCGPAYSRGVCRGTFLCSTAGPTLAPRRLLPFGRISLRETARPVIGPTGADVLPSPSRLRRAGSPTAKPRRLLPFGRISLRETAQPVIGPTGADVLPSPSRLRRAGSPTAKPRRLLPFGRISLRETARPVVAPAGGNVLATPFSLRSNVAPRSHPGPPRFQSGFCCAKTGGRGRPLSDGRALTKSENIIFCASFCHPLRSPYPHCTLPRVRFSGIGQKKKPQRKTAAAVAYHSLFLSFRLCGTRAPACFVIRIHSPSVSSRGENKKGKRARFPFWLCSERLISARSAFSLFFAALVPDIARLIRTHTSLFGTTLPPPPAPSRSAFQ